MNLFNAIAVGFKEIWAHKFRYLLTMLGIILGVSSLVGMSALVAGMEKGAREALVAIGALNMHLCSPINTLHPEHRHSWRHSATGTPRRQQRQCSRSSIEGGG